METINDLQTLNDEINQTELEMSENYSLIERILPQLQFLESSVSDENTLNLMKLSAVEGDIVYGLEAADTFQEKVAKAVKTVYEAIKKLVKNVIDWYNKFLNFDLITAKRRTAAVIKKYHDKLVANKVNNFKREELGRIAKDVVEDIGKQKSYKDVMATTRKGINDLKTAANDDKITYTEEEVAAAKVAMRESEFSYIGDMRELGALVSSTRDFVEDNLLAGEESLSMFIGAMVTFKDVPTKNEVEKTFDTFSRKVSNTSIDFKSKLVIGKSIYMFVFEDDDDPAGVMEVISNKDWKAGNGMSKAIGYDDYLDIDTALSEIIGTNFVKGYSDLVKAMDKGQDALEKAYENLLVAAKNPDFDENTKAKIQFFLKSWRGLSGRASKELSARTSLLRDITRLQKYIASNNIV